MELSESEEYIKKIENENKTKYFYIRFPIKSIKIKNITFRSNDGRRHMFGFSNLFSSWKQL